MVSVKLGWVRFGSDWIRFGQSDLVLIRLGLIRPSQVGVGLVVLGS